MEKREKRSRSQLLTYTLRLVTVFFFTYCVFELPSNLLLKKLRPSRWLPLIMVAWGVVMVSDRPINDSSLIVYESMN
jgi:hypothetical protein